MKIIFFLTQQDIWKIQKFTFRAKKYSWEIVADWYFWIWSRKLILLSRGSGPLDVGKEFFNKSQLSQLGIGNRSLRKSFLKMIKKTRDILQKSVEGRNKSISEGFLFIESYGRSKNMLALRDNVIRLSVQWIFRWFHLVSGYRWIRCKFLIDSMKLLKQWNWLRNVLFSRFFVVNWMLLFSSRIDENKVQIEGIFVTITWEKGLLSSKAPLCSSVGYWFNHS